MAEIILPDFFIVPSALVADKNIQPKDTLVYAAVYWFTKLRNEKCTASNKTISKVIGCSDSAVAHSLVRLNKYGYIQVRMDGQNHREEIIPLIAFSRIDTPSSNEQGGWSNEQGGVAETSKDPSSNEQHNKNIEEEELKEDNLPTLHKDETHGNNTPSAAVNNYGIDWNNFFTHYLQESGKRALPTQGRKDKFKTRLHNFSVEEMKIATTNCFKDDFYSGKNDRGWRADIDYILRSDEIMEKLLNLKIRSKSGMLKE